MPAIVNPSNGIKRIATGILISICLLFSVISNGHAETTPTDTSGAVGKAAAGYGDSSMSSTGGTALPDLFTGTMSYSIPIEVPPGRKGMNPQIALTYRSYNGNGWLGVGWELEVSSIQRSLKGGVDYAGTSKNYQLRRTGASLDLVNISGSDYQAKIEGEFTRITQMPATTASGNQPYWIATDRMGTRYTFGDTASSRQDDTPNNNPARIFKWCLTRVEDTNGNFMTLSYFKDQGQIESAGKSRQRVGGASPPHGKG
jgi:hypothetical protein